MDILFISLTGIVSILSFLFGIRVYSSDKKSVISRSFSVFAFSVAVWVVTDFTLYQQNLADYQTFLNRLDLAVVTILIASLTYFVYIFPVIVFKINKMLLIIGLIVSIILSLTILLSNQIVGSAFMQDYGSNFTQGPMFLVFAAYGLIFVLLTLIILITKIIKFKDAQKQQIKLILYGVGIFLLGNMLFNLLIPMITDSFVYGRFGTYSSIFLAGFIAYAILKTHLFNLKIIVTESAAVIINVISVISIFISNSTIEGLLRTLFAIFVFYGSWLMIGSVRREIKQKEELQTLTSELAQANAHLKDLDKMKTEFVSLASHELLTPVSAIEGYLSMMLDEHLAKVEDPTAARYLDRIYKSSRRLARLIADMLNISRIEEGRLLVEKKDTDVSELIDQVIDEIKFKAEERKQKVIFDDPGEWKSFCDPDKIKEVVVNLIGNSIKYSRDPGDIHVSIKKVPLSDVQAIWKKIEDNAKSLAFDDQEAISSAVDPHYRELVGTDQLMISVKDQGIGIPKEELPKLFKKFHRVGNYSTQESQGTGLGLYISKSLVELHHGRIWPDSEGEGKGSTFTFTLPDFSAKEAIVEMEKDVNQQKEQLKPLAKPMHSTVDEEIQDS